MLEPRSSGKLAEMGAIHDLDLALQLEPRNPVALSSRSDAKRMLLNNARGIVSMVRGEYVYITYIYIIIINNNDDNNSIYSMVMMELIIMMIIIARVCI